MEKTMEEENNEKIGHVKCQLCGKLFGMITPQHLKRFHGITVEQYREKFPEQEMWGAAFRSSYKYSGTELFKNKELDKIPKVGEIRIPQDLVAFEEKEKGFKEEKKAMPLGKAEIFEELRKHFGYVETNYFIQKVDLEGHLVYRVITDFFVPVSKLIIDFPNSYWHNYEPSSESLKKLVIPNDGYKVIRILSRNPSPSDVTEEVSKQKESGNFDLFK